MKTELANKLIEAIAFIVAMILSGLMIAALGWFVGWIGKIILVGWKL